MAAYQTTGLNNFTELTPDEWDKILYGPNAAAIKADPKNQIKRWVPEGEGWSQQNVFNPATKNNLTALGDSYIGDASIPNSSHGVFYDPATKQYYVMGAANSGLRGKVYRVGSGVDLNSLLDAGNGSYITGLTDTTEDPTKVYIGTSHGSGGLFDNPVTNKLFSNPIAEALVQKPTEYLNRGLSDVVTNTAGNGWLGQTTRGGLNLAELYGPSMTISNDDSDRRNELVTSRDTQRTAGLSPIVGAVGGGSGSPIGGLVGMAAGLFDIGLADAARNTETADLNANSNSRALDRYYDNLASQTMENTAKGAMASGLASAASSAQAATAANSTSNLPAWANAANAQKAYNVYDRARQGDTEGAILGAAGMYGGALGQAATYYAKGKAIYNAAASGDTTGLISQLAIAAGVPPAYVNAAALASKGNATPQQVIAAAKAMYNSGSTTGLAGNVLNRYLFSESSNA